MRRGLSFVNKGDDSLYATLEGSGYTPYVDHLSHQYPETEAHMLLVVGTLDPQTVPEWAQHAWETAYQRPQQRLVMVPYAVHAVASLPGLSRVSGGGADCAFQLAASFYRSGGREVDSSCLQEVLPPDWVGADNSTREASVRVLGTPDLWGSR